MSDSESEYINLQNLILDKEIEYFKFYKNNNPEHPIIARIIGIDMKIDMLSKQKYSLMYDFFKDARANATDEYIEELKKLWEQDNDDTDIESDNDNTDIESE